MAIPALFTTMSSRLTLKNGIYCVLHRFVIGHVHLEYCDRARFRGCAARCAVDAEATGGKMCRAGTADGDEAPAMRTTRVSI